MVRKYRAIEYFKHNPTCITVYIENSLHVLQILKCCFTARTKIPMAAVKLILYFTGTSEKVVANCDQICKNRPYGHKY